MKIDITANGVRVNGERMSNPPSKDAIADQLKWMLFGINPEEK